jgi:hypothetical protein
MGNVLRYHNKLEEALRYCKLALRLRRDLYKQASPSDLLTIGVAASGQIDQDNGVIPFMPMLGLSDVPLAALVQEDFPCHIALINDIGAQGIGEQKIGTGKHIQHLVYLICRIWHRVQHHHQWRSVYRFKATGWRIWSHND